MNRLKTAGIRTQRVIPFREARIIDFYFPVAADLVSIQMPHVQSICRQSCDSIGSRPMKPTPNRRQKPV